MISKIKSQIIKLYIKFSERKYKCDDTELKYIFTQSKSGSERLTVVFSGFAGHGERSKYNYVRTLQNDKSNRLYILDDFGYMSVGSYYLGESFRIYKVHAIEKLIESIRNKCGASKVAFVGSSKGGSSALLYGMKMNADCIVCGSPQYQIAEYLHQNDYHMEILAAITGNNAEYEQKLDSIIADAIANNAGNTKVFLMYSSNESSYEIDVKFLIEALKNKGITCDLQDMKYKEHSETGRYFIPYLLKTLSEL